MFVCLSFEVHPLRIVVVFSKYPTVQFTHRFERVPCLQFDGLADIAQEISWFRDPEAIFCFWSWIINSTELSLLAQSLLVDLLHYLSSWDLINDVD